MLASSCGEKTKGKRGRTGCLFFNYFSQQIRLASLTPQYPLEILLFFLFVLRWILVDFRISLPPGQHKLLVMLCIVLPACSEISGGWNDRREGKSHANLFFTASKAPNISDEKAYSCNWVGKIGVKSLHAEQVSVICSLGAWCQPYNSDLDSHKRQNSFELHMLDCALQVNPGSAVTSRLRPGEGTPRPSTATRLSARRFIRAVDWWISFE